MKILEGKMEKDKVSVIVAVYKAEVFLDRCVDSIINQTYKNLEIILVDDGSPDNCPKMCDNYAQTDNRIKVIHKTNGGVSSAWNAGLDNATGEYITFVDSDDWVDGDYVKELYDTLKKHDGDISICCFYTNKDQDIYFDNKNFPRYNYFYPAKDCLSAFLGEKPWSHTVWGKLYKRAIFNNLRYPENIMCAEDMYLICDICKEVNNGIATSDKILYYYTIHGASVSATANEFRFDSIRSARHILTIIESNCKQYKYACKLLFDLYRREIRLFKRNARNDLVVKMNVWLKEDYKKYSKYLKGKEKIRNHIFRYNSPLYELTHKILRKFKRK